MTVARALLLLAILAIAGCSSKQPDDGGEPTSTTTSPPVTTPRTSSGTPSPTPLTPNQPGFAWTDCVGFDTSAFWPGADAPTNPPGWGATGVAAQIGVAGWRCARVSVAHFERGPVLLVLEDSNNIDPPPACHDGAETSIYSALLSIGIDDAELVDYLRSTYGMPAYLIEGTSSDMPLGGATIHTNEWGPPGTTPSSIQNVGIDMTQQSDVRPYRYFWANGDTVASLDVVYESQVSFAGSKPALGTFAPPMRLAEVYPTHIGLGDWHTNASADGVIQSWASMDCDPPSAPS